MNPWEKITPLSPEEIRALQHKKLQQFIPQYVYPFSAHYRKVFDDQKIDPRSIRTADDLRRIPFTSKADFADKNPDSSKHLEFILKPDKSTLTKAWPLSKKLPLLANKIFRGQEYVTDRMSREFRPVFMTFTTGTTMKPTTFFYTNYDIKNLHTSGHRMLSLFEVAQDERIVNIFPYAPHLAFWQVVFGGFEACVLALSTGGGKVLGTDGNIGAIMKMKPSVILGVPSYTYHLFRTAAERGCRMDFVKKVVLGAARVTIGFKMKLAQLLQEMGATDVSIFGTYGFTEARCAWAECPTSLDVSSGYHLYPDKEIFEVIDPDTGEPKKEGEDGEIVYTSLDSRASAVLRYRTGDFVKGGITWEPCPHCHRSVPRLSSDITRLSDVKDLQLSKIKGTLVNLNHLVAILSDMELIDEWQIEIRKRNNDPFDMDELVIYLSLRRECNRNQLCDDIKKKFLEVTELSPNDIVFLDRAEIVKRLELETANKAKRIMDSRPKD